MNQSGIIAAALIAGFVLYLAANDRLGVYWAILTGGGTPATVTASSSSGGGSSGAGGLLGTAAGIVGGLL